VTSLIGRRLGRYEIRAELGRGGMARVYRAVDTLLQRPVALKVLAAQLSLDPEFIRRFEREATTAANLHHPAIVTIYDVGEQDGLYYIAMEYISGRSLHAVLEERTTLGLGYAVSLLDPVARALDYAHAHGAVHRDIKPHNILIARDGRVLLTDFGIAQTPDSDGERLTRTGIFMGTPEYISPEQAEARRVDGRSDLYALGVVAYEVITGRVPFSGPTPQLIVAHAQLPPPPPTSVVAHLPGELDEVLARALAKRPERRYPTGLALVDALRTVAERYGTPLATREQLAGLADAAGASPLPDVPQAIPAPPPRSRPAAPPAVAVEPAPAGVVTASAHTVPAPRSAEAPAPQPAATSPRQPASEGRPGATSGRPQPRGDGSALPLLLIGALLVLVTAGFIFFVARGLAGLTTPGPVPGATTPGLAAPSPTGGAAASVTPAPSATLAPTVPVAPTSAPTPGEATAVAPPPAPSATPAPPPPPPAPSATPAPPPPEPSATPTPSPATATLAPPTVTPGETPETPTATMTETTEPPTATLPASPTPTEEPTLLGSPTVVTPVNPSP